MKIYEVLFYAVAKQMGKKAFLVFKIRENYFY